MSVFILKLIAMVSMFIDHTAFWLVNNNLVMRNIGRFAFVIYCFLMAESYYHLKDKPDRLNKHVIKLLFLFVLSEVPYDLFDHRKLMDFSSQNVILTLLLGFLSLIIAGYIKRKINNKTLAGIGFILSVLAMAELSILFKSEYKFRGVLLIAMFYLYLEKADSLKLKDKVFMLCGIDLIYCLLGLWTRSDFGAWEQFVETTVRMSKWTVGMIISFLPLVFYNRKLGYHEKWFKYFYSYFYPLQFVILLIARFYIRGF